MKNFKKLVLGIMCFTLLLSGCGNGGASTPKGIISSEKPIIAYYIRNMDKDNSPTSIFVFQNGKTKEYDTRYTMGELSKMTDEEILSALQKEYIEQELKSAKSSLEYANKRANDYQSKIDDLNKEYEYTWYELWQDTYTEAYQLLDGKSIESNLLGDMKNLLQKKGYTNGKTITEDWQALVDSDPNENFYKNIWFDEMYNWLYRDVTGSPAYFQPGLEAYDKALANTVEKKKAAREESKKKYEDKLAEENINIAELESELAELEKGEKDTYNRRTIINIVTDTSGNNTNEEQIIVLGKKRVITKLSISPYGTLYCEEGSVIYDSTYYGYTLCDGYNYLFFRNNNNLTFDSVNTKDVYIDLENYDQFFEQEK